MMMMMMMMMMMSNCADVFTNIKNQKQNKKVIVQIVDQDWQSLTLSSGKHVRDL